MAHFMRLWLVDLVSYGWAIQREWAMATSRGMSSSRALFMAALIFSALIWALVGWQRERIMTWGALPGAPTWVRRALQGGILILFFYAFLFSPWSAKLLRSWRLLPAAAWVILALWVLEGDPRGRSLLRVTLVVWAGLTFVSAYTKVVTYPFSLNWSEGNRLWDRSLIFGRERYLYPLDKPIPVFNDPGRILLWGLIYLLPWASIAWVRFWDAFLFTAPYLLWSWTLFRGRATTSETRAWGLILALWGFLFLAQGPIYTPLVLAALLVWYGAQQKRLAWRTAWLLAAGYLVRITRFTWAFAPFMWALFLFLGAGDPRTRAWWKRHLLPLLGTLVGSLLLVQWIDGERFVNLLARLDGHAGIAQLRSHEQFGHLTLQALWRTLTYQSFLWERLFPNPTFPLGILPAILLGTGAAVAALGWFWHQHRQDVPVWLRAYGALMLAAFFVVGLIISAKIGGGNNLHNLDMYLVGLLMVIGWHWQKFGDALLRGLPKSLLLSALFGPLVVLLLAGYAFSAAPSHLPSPEKQQEILAFVQQAAREAQAEGEVVFMDQRQLLTFGYVRLPLVPDYDKKLLMDRAMSRDEAFFRQYYQDLHQRRFSLIVTEVLKERPEAANEAFAEESAVWTAWVAQPTLCYYEPLATFREVHMQILRPRPPEETLDCAARLPIPLNP